MYLKVWNLWYREKTVWAIYIVNGSMSNRERHIVYGVNAIAVFKIKCWFAVRAKETRHFKYIDPTISPNHSTHSYLHHKRLNASKIVESTTFIWWKDNIFVILKAQICFGTHKAHILLETGSSFARQYRFTPNEMVCAGICIENHKMSSLNLCFNVIIVMSA